MLASLLKHRRAFISAVALACLLYTSTVTVDLLKRLSKRDQCHLPGDSLRRMMPRSLESSRQLHTESDNSGDKKLPYRLDMIRADLEADSEGKEMNELFDQAEDKTDYFGCSDFDRIPRTRKEVEENLRGNRGISFMKVRINGVTIPVVLKEANRLYRTIVEEYKYNSAKREILYLVKLRGLRGIPRIFGSCVEDLRVRYLVERVNGLTLCTGNGSSSACAAGDRIVDLVKQDPNPELAALSFAYSTTTFFVQMEERHLFMEDVSGLNFMLSPNWQLFMVDADSLVFYNDSRIYSHVSCSADEHCPELSGNLWVDFSLNKKIYKHCRDLKGICEDQECRGYGTELHTCGIANWYICRLSTTFNFDENVRKLFSQACSCMKKYYPHQRCTFREASELLRKALRIFLEKSGNSLPR